MKDTLRLRAISLWKTAQKAESLQKGLVNEYEEREKEEA